MAYHADHLAAGIQGVERIQRSIERFAIERAEPFIKKQRIDARFVAHQIGQRQRQRQADKEAFTAGEGSGIAYRIRLPGINHFQLQCFAGLALKLVAPVQAIELMVRQPDQVIQR